MAQHRNGGKPWTDAEEAELAGLLLAKTHPAVIAARLGRSVVSIGDKSRELRRRANGLASAYAVRRDSPLTIGQAQAA